MVVVASAEKEVRDAWASGSPWVPLVGIQFDTHWEGHPVINYCHVTVS